MGMFKRLKDLKLTWKAFILVVVPILFEIAFVTRLCSLLTQAEHDIEMESRSKNIISQAHELTKSFYDAGQTLAIYCFTQNQAAATRYDEIVAKVPEQIHNLEKDTDEFSKGDQSFEPVATASFNGLQAFKLSKQRADEGDRRSLFDKEKSRVLAAYVAEVSKFIEHERELANSIPENRRKSRQSVVNFLWFGVFVSTMLGLGLAVFFNVSTTNRIKILLANTKRLAKREELIAPIAGNDEIGQLDSTFHQMADELAAAAKHKAELVSMVSHDLRTPLMSMQVSLELLSDGVLGEMSPDAQSELKVAEYSATRLIHLINDLLDVEKMDAGKLELNLQECTLSVLFERSARSVKAYAERQKISLKFPESDDRIFADHERIVQVLINLLSNAIKFSPKGSEVAMDYVNNAGYTEVRVIDRGRGIPPAFKDKIFERFQQVQASDAKEKKGTGLGLAICKAIIDAHNGSIGVESEEGKGSIFWFRIPKSQPV